jgi:hypothetical protein
MKKAIQILLITLCFAACQKEALKPPAPEGCAFGIDIEASHREGLSFRKKPGTPPPPPPPPVYSPVILLDFDGHYFANTAWNWNGPVTVNGSDLSTEAMQEVFDKAVEAFAPWQVSVTTSDSVYFLAPSNRRIRCVLTTSHEWYGTVGGTAFVNSFTFTDDTPCFVFTAALGYNTKYIKEATVHEIGHSLNLYHQSTWENGVMTHEYNFGGGGVAPIMGNAYYQPLSVWHTGLNANGDLQNDTLIINQLLTRR